MIPLTLNINDIDAAYHAIRSHIAVEGMTGVMIFIVAITFICRLMEVYKESQNNDDGTPNAANFMKLVEHLGILFVMCALMPTILSLTETVFGKIMQEMQNGFGSERYNMADILKRPIMDDWESKSVSTNIGNIAINPIGYAFDYLSSFLCGSIGATLYLHASTLFIAARYIILLLLEMVSPVAIACLYNKDTRGYFYMWLKNMLICYLMVPAFICASQFSDEIVKQFILTTSWPLFCMIIYSIILKFSLLGIVRSKIWNLF